jgi:quercetin dioxygenase-like cupin family protein
LSAEFLETEREGIMHFRTIGSVFFGATALAASAAAQPAPAPGPTPPTVVTAGKLATVTDAPRYFKVTSITLAAGEKSNVSGPSGIFYQLSGSTSVSLGGETKTVNPGEGIYIQDGATAQLQAGTAGSSTFFHFFLARAADLDRRAETAPATVKELYRSAAPIPDLKMGAYDINLTRRTFPPQMRITPPHHRSGAALYYIFSGTGSITTGGATTAEGPGSFIYEPYSLVHQWANTGGEPVIYVTFNINPEGVAAVVPGAPEKSQ